MRGSAVMAVAAAFGPPHGSASTKGKEPHRPSGVTLIPLILWLGQPRYPRGLRALFRHDLHAALTPGTGRPGPSCRLRNLQSPVAERNRHESQELGVGGGRAGVAIPGPRPGPIAQRSRVRHRQGQGSAAPPRSRPPRARGVRYSQGQGASAPRDPGARLGGLTRPASGYAGHPRGALQGRDSRHAGERRIPRDPRHSGDAGDAGFSTGHTAAAAVPKAIRARTIREPPTIG
jgi:hypothetical protein